ncbi:MAG TPA: hypothetical protein VGC79_07140 [Polyangiaceae bacterium]
MPIDDPLPVRAGQSLGRYGLLAPVAKGGMGQVWVGRLRGARFPASSAIPKTAPPAKGKPAKVRVQARARPPADLIAPDYAR